MTDKIKRIFRCKVVLLVSGIVALLSVSAPSCATVIVSAEAFNPSSGAAMGEMTFPIDVNSDDTFSLTDASFIGPSGSWALSNLNVNGDIDPFTSLGFQVQNNMGFTVNFLMSISVPIIPIPGATLHGGSTGITVTDADLSGSATVAALSGKPYYSGQIDGSTVLSLFNDPFSLTAAPLQGDSNSTNTNLGLPATLPSGAALATIGIVIEFSLSAGDQMSSTNLFRVEPVPEPTTLAFGGLALLGIFTSRRRRLI